MQLGEVIRELEVDAHAVLAATGDVILMTRVNDMAGRFGEDPAEYATCAVRRFANLAGDEDWLSLMNVVERAADPGIACLVHMIGWSLEQDAAPVAEPHAGCSCGGVGCG
ncbi:MAG: hypothetical protein ACOY4O_18300 [Pseudomonadota bacterium]|jgi:hypothetical protein